MRKIIWSLVAIPLVLGLTAAPASAAVRQPTLSIPVHADGTWTFEDGRVESHTADFGVITSVGGGSITVIRPDRQQVTVALPDTTCVRVGGMPATLDDLHPYMRAIVLSLRADDGSLSALAVRTGVPLIRPLQPTCGIFAGWVHGVVTVRYRDGSTRTFTFDRTPPSSTDPSGSNVLRAHAASARRSLARIGEVRIARLARARFS
ncbi:MAG: hypothetical protein ACRDH7_15690 [Actinomycetota bacterium]